jgi:rhamnogalacturonan endolyase
MFVIQFKKTGRVAAIAMSLACAASAAAAVVVTQTSGEVTFTNSQMSLTMDKSGGTIESIILGGQELLGSGYGYLDANTPSGGYWNLATGSPSYAVTTGSDWAKITFTTTPSAAMPFGVSQNIVLRDGETGMHMYTQYDYTQAGSAELSQTRFVLRGDSNIFDHHSVTDDRFGVMPTPTELSNGTPVMDATTQLQPGSAYEAQTGKDVYTKYDWTVSEKDNTVQGYYGELGGTTYGAWVVRANKESLNGGPTKQSIPVHQTSTTPALLNVVQSRHYGSAGVEATTGWSKTYGPFYTHFNSGTDPVALRADAVTYADVSVHQGFYDTLSIPGYTLTADRGAVEGAIQLDNGQSLDGATIVLSDNGVEYQFSANGNQYWNDVNSDGTFQLPGVKPGTYRLSVNKPGVYGEFFMDDVLVGTGATIDVGNLTWTAPDNGRLLWQVGVPDRSAAEFKHGDDFRRWGLWNEYAGDFPGDVNFVVGQSTEREDWNFAHWEARTDGSGSPTWQIQFGASGLPQDGVATLTIAVASSYRSDLKVMVNGVEVDNWDMPYDSSVAARSGIQGAYDLREITFAADLLNEGQNNTITLSNNNPNLWAENRAILYDAIRLEVGEPVGTFEQINITASADTNVRETWPDENRGTSSVIEVRSISSSVPGRQNISLLRFDLPLLGGISDAELTLQSVQQSGTDFLLYGLLEGAAGEDWDEYTVTYNTAPAIFGGDGDDTTQDLNLSDVVLLATYSHAANDIVNITSQALIDFLSQDTDGAATFLLVSPDDANRNVYYASRESGLLAPSLSITATTLTAAAQLDLTGDLNGDGFVGIEDLNLVLGHWNQVVTAGHPLWGDPSGDGFVGIEDLNYVLGNWNSETPPSADSLANVPEPHSLLTLGTVMLFGGLSRRRRICRHGY